MLISRILRVFGLVLFPACHLLVFLVPPQFVSAQIDEELKLEFFLENIDKDYASELPGRFRSFSFRSHQGLIDYSSPEQNLTPLGESVHRTIFHAGSSGVLKSLRFTELEGELLFFFDGSATPQFTTLVSSLFDSEETFIPDFLKTEAEGVYTIYFPFPFGRSLKIKYLGPASNHVEGFVTFINHPNGVISWVPAMGLNDDSRKILLSLEEKEKDGGLRVKESDWITSPEVKLQRPAENASQISSVIYEEGEQATKAGQFVYLEAPVQFATRDTVELTTSGEDVEFWSSIEVNDSVSYMRLSLDLPLGWMGKLSGADKAIEVFDIGWPFLDTWDPGLGSQKYLTRILPPENRISSSYFSQLRLEVTMKNGEWYRETLPVEIKATPNSEKIVKIDYYGRIQSEEPFFGEPGDKVVVTYLHRPDTDAQLLVKSEWGDRVYRPEGIFKKGEGEFLEIYPVGDEPDWVAPISFVEPRLSGSQATTPTLELRRGILPGRPQDMAERALSYIEKPSGVYRRPEPVIDLSAEDLLKTLQLLSFSKDSEIEVQQTPMVSLQDVKVARVGLSIRDRDSLAEKPLESVLMWRPAFAGERVQVKHEEITGRKVFGFEFAHSSHGGVVAIRDCDGRFLAQQSLQTGSNVVLPRLVLVEGYIPNREDFLYLEVLGSAPGSGDLEVGLSRLLIFEENSIEEVYSNYFKTF